MIDIRPFVAWLMRQVWRFGKRLPAMVRWAWANRSRVAAWLARGLSYGTVAGLILQAIG